MMEFIVPLCVRMFRLFLICRYISAWLGLNVQTYGITILSLVSFMVNTVFLSSRFEFLMLSSISKFGFRRFNNKYRSCFKMVGSEVIVLSLRARLYGMLYLVCLGRRDCYSKHCLLLVGL